MGALTETLLTFEEFERLPERPGKRELLKGELIELPPADFRHNQITHRIFKTLDPKLDELHRAGQATDLGAVYMEMGYQLPGGAWVQPDVSITHAGQPAGKYLEGAPAIAVEVISPGNTAEEMQTKVELYFENGAREVWRVYRKQGCIVVHTPGASREVHDILTTPLLPGFSLPIPELLAN